MDILDEDSKGSSTASMSANGFSSIDVGLSSQDVAMKLQAEKVKILLKQNDALRKQVLQVQKENKDNIRVKRIKKLEADLEEKQIVFEAFKSKLSDVGLSPSDIELLVDNALKGPNRIRPPRVEELQAEIAQLKGEKLKLEKKLKSSSSSSSSSGAGSESHRSNASSFANLLPPPPGISLTSSSSSSAALQAELVRLNQANKALEDRLRSSEDKLCVAEAEVEASQQALKVHKEMLLEAQDQCRLQAIYEEKLKRSEAKRKDLQKDAEYLHEELMNCLVLNEKYSHDIRSLNEALSQQQHLHQSGQAFEEQQQLRDQAMAQTHRKIVDTLEATIARLQGNEAAMTAQLEQMRGEMQRTREEMEKKHQASEQAEELINQLKEEMRRVTEQNQEIMESALTAAANANNSNTNIVSEPSRAKSASVSAASSSLDTERSSSSFASSCLQCAHWKKRYSDLEEQRKRQIRDFQSMFVSIETEMQRLQQQLMEQSGESGYNKSSTNTEGIIEALRIEKENLEKNLQISQQLVVSKQNEYNNLLQEMSRCYLACQMLNMHLNNLESQMSESGLVAPARPSLPIVLTLPNQLAPSSSSQSSSLSKPPLLIPDN